MDTKKIELLLSAVSIGSIKKAADILNYTQSGLGYAINVFEKEIGITLTHRDVKGISLTPEGRLLRPYLEEIVDAVQRFDQQAALLSNSVTPTLNIGAWPSIARNWLPDFIHKFGKENPEVQISLHVGTDELSTMLKEGTIDCAIGPVHITDHSDVLYLCDQDIYVVLPADAPFSDDEPVPFHKLDRYTVLLPENMPGGPGAYAYQQWCKTLPPTQKLRISASDGSIKISMVEKGLGLTFLASVYKSECPPGVRMLPVDPPLYSTTILAKSPAKPSTELLDTFGQQLQDYVKTL